jgi:hypothetical protein
VRTRALSSHQDTDDLHLDTAVRVTVRLSVLIIRSLVLPGRQG